MKIRIILASIIVFAVLLLNVGCMRAYDVPELVEVSPSQTAFLIPLDGETSKQATFSSEKFLAAAKVATKRVQIPHRFLQTGRMSNDGRYIPTMKVIIVERKPVTREWTDSSDTGTSAKNQAVIAETRESLRLVARMNCVAQIDEEDAVKYLYRYNEKTLDEVMDTEIRARIESTFVEQCAKYYLRDEENGILAHKISMMKEVRDEVIPYFKGRGITINVIGLKGDFTYETTIQTAINERFQTIQERAKADADSYIAAKLKQNGGLEYLIKKKELEIRKQHEDNITAAIAAWKAGAKVPQAIGGGGTIFSLPIQQSAEPPK